MYINNSHDLRTALRHGEHAWPGGYPMFFITNDGEALSFATVREEYRNVLSSVKRCIDDGWRVVAVAINYEDGELADAHTGERIESAYAD